MLDLWRLVVWRADTNVRGVLLKAADSPALRFEGFKKQDKKNLKEFLSASCDVEMEDEDSEEEEQ